MSAAPATEYAEQKAIERAIRAMQALGLEIGGVEIAPGGVVRVLTKGEIKADGYGQWKKNRAGADG